MLLMTRVLDVCCARNKKKNAARQILSEDSRSRQTKTIPQDDKPAVCTINALAQVPHGSWVIYGLRVEVRADKMLVRVCVVEKLHGRVVSVKHLLGDVHIVDHDGRHVVGH